MNNIVAKPRKPLGHKAYGSIPHLPGSRRGPSDRGLSQQHARIATTAPRDRNDMVIVQEKVDGGCVAVARVDGEIKALGRAGYPAITSPYEQHRVFHDWVERNNKLFSRLLKHGERVVGEWLAQAHGTRYDLPHDPFVAFDLMVGQTRAPWWEFMCRVSGILPTPRVIHVGGPRDIGWVMEHLEPSGHGALDPVEGAVWRVERNGAVDFLGKYVRPDKIDGAYLPEITGGEPVWNWAP